jgi:hypothetical protein
VAQVRVVDAPSGEKPSTGPVHGGALCALQKPRKNARFVANASYGSLSFVACAAGTLDSELWAGRQWQHDT